MKYRLGSLFSGIGGLELGFEATGAFTTVFQVEINAYARSVLERHWPKVTRFEDVHNVGKHNLPVCDIICGGFPCQGISIAGKGAGLADPRSGLWREFARVVSELRPRIAVVENSGAITSRGLYRVVGDLTALGYDAEWEIVSACAVGAPHTRERLFVVAYTDRFNAPRLVVQSELKGAVQPRDYEPRPRAWLQTTPDSPRGTDGVPERLERTRAIGNAVVPQVAEFVARRILESGIL